MNTPSETRLQQVNPALASKIHALAAQLLTEGIVIIVMQGMRTWAEQDALYAQGRTTPGKIVTNAKGGQSYHNLGCAVDCAPLNPDKSVDWNANHPQWKCMEELGVSLGLVSGANWVRLVDAPHFQLTGRFPVGAPNDEARQLFQQSPETLWNEINKP
jgi:peptidoglycan L-alanyl-D-glutamate endopeptidase CwlK